MNDTIEDSGYIVHYVYNLKTILKTMETSGTSIKVKPPNSSTIISIHQAQTTLQKYQSRKNMQKYYPPSTPVSFRIGNFVALNAL